MLNSTFVVPQVLTHILPAEEFWAEHSPAMTATAKAKLGQEVGVSGSFLSDIKPQAGTQTNNFRRGIYSGIRMPNNRKPDSVSAIHDHVILVLSCPHPFPQPLFTHYCIDPWTNTISVSWS